MCAPARWPDLRGHTGSRAPVADIWTLRKSDTDYAWLHDIADASAPKVRDAFLRAVEQVRGTPKEAALREALASGSVERVLAVLNVKAAMETAVAAQVVPILEDAFIAAGRAAPAATIPSQILGTGVAYRFDIANPETLAFLRSYEMGMIREVTAETQLAVRGIVEEAFKFGGHPRDQAKRIRSLVGLTQRGAIAVRNYEDALREEGRAEDQIARMTERYRQRMLKLRATTIARTETIRASNQGAVAAWRGAAAKGLLSRATFRMQWLVTPDDRTCPNCAPVPGLNDGGVPLGGIFKTPLGNVDAPPLHPNCRCVLVAESF